MHRRDRLALGLVTLWAMGAGQVLAQYPYYPGYGGYGWGGWGGQDVGTVQGTMARGLGYYNQEAAAAHQEAAVANAVNENSVMRWNQYMYESQREANQREYLRMSRKMKRDSLSGELVQKRLLENPTPEDLETGAALNAVYDQLADPRIQSSALRLAKAPVSSKAIQEIPFANASRAVVISLHQLTAKGRWPLALQNAYFEPERLAYQQAASEAIKDVDEGQVSPAAIQNLRNAALRLRAKLAKAPPKNHAEMVEAENYVRTLLGISRMLQDPQVSTVLAELKKIPNTTLGSLLGFMHTYNLRFGPTKTPGQRAVYHQIYPLLVAARDKIVNEAGVKDSTGVKRDQDGKPIDFFQGMHLDYLEGRKATSDATKKSP